MLHFQSAQRSCSVLSLYNTLLFFSLQRWADQTVDRFLDVLLQFFFVDRVVILRGIQAIDFVLQGTRVVSLRPLERTEGAERIKEEGVIALF